MAIAQLSLVNLTASKFISQKMSFKSTKARSKYELKMQNYKRITLLKINLV